MVRVIPVPFPLLKKRVLNKFSGKVLRTDMKGTIVITSTGTKLSCKTVETQNPSSSGNSSNSSGSSSSLPAVPTLGSTVVYITSSGSKYHNQACGNGNYMKSTLKAVLSRGLEPCSKCYHVR